MHDFQPQEIGRAKTRAQSRLREFELQSRNLLQSGNSLKLGDPGSGHLLFHRLSPEAQRISSLALEVIEASRSLTEDFQLTAKQGGLGLQQVSINRGALDSFCPSRPICTSTRDLEYRTIDGSCNNPSDTLLGKSNTQMQRILPAVYDDGNGVLRFETGIWMPRARSVTGQPLSSARLISATVFLSDDREPRDPLTSVGFVQWGQFLDHDITHGGVFTIAGTDTHPKCCRANGIPITTAENFACFPIEIPRLDPFYSQFNQRCMELVRTTLALRLDCTLGYAEQVVRAERPKVKDPLWILESLSTWFPIHRTNNSVTGLTAPMFMEAAKRRRTDFESSKEDGSRSVAALADRRFFL
ncbi:unnamed protein product [Cyprideis torosa]|uniref:Uncharacterized protein n=1 Tax=Cyprideis torosa TaxID=163714 RepID=A0A7R8WRH2_9CRUS|nr:unnamed protein product [Cyprideis torosa]CAG0904175.1 unnamed protein product [Cyprideis torosa]